MSARGGKKCKLSRDRARLDSQAKGPKYAAPPATWASCDNESMELAGISGS